MASASPSLLHEFLNTLNRAIQAKDQQFLANILLISPHDIANNPLMTTLRAEVLTLTPAYIENACYEVLGEDWVSLTDMVVGYVGGYLRDIVVPAVVASAIGGSAQGVAPLQGWFDALGTFLGQVSSAFSSAQGILLLHLVKVSTNILTSLAIRIDLLTGNPQQPAANSASRIVLRAFNIALGDRTTGTNLGKKEGAFHLANLLFKLYFKLDQTRLSPTIHLNLSQSALPPLLSTHFPKSQHVTYTYYLGRHHLSLSTTHASHLIPAFTNLTTSYTLTPPYFLSQRRQILIYLLVSGILIGKSPSKQGLYSLPEAWGLEEIFAPLVTALRKGNFRSWKEGLTRWEPWLKRKGIYLLLLTCGEEILWQSLARRCFILTKEIRPPPNPFNMGTAKTPPPQLGLSGLLRLANFLHSPISTQQQQGWGLAPLAGAKPGDILFSQEPETFTLDDIEGVVLDLLDQGLLKGYIARQQKVVVLKREGNGFVGVEEARRWKYGIGGGDELVLGNGNGGAGAGGGLIGGKKMGGVVRLSGLKTIGS